MVEEGSSSSTPVDNSNNEEIPPYLREEPPEGSIMVFLFISKFKFKFTIEISKKIIVCFCLGEHWKHGILFIFNL